MASTYPAGETRLVEYPVLNNERARVSDYTYPRPRASSIYASDSTEDGEGKGTVGPVTMPPRGNRDIELQLVHADYESCSGASGPLRASSNFRNAWIWLV